MLFIGWTTVASSVDAERLALEAIGSGAAVCVQIEGPIHSIYRWEGKVERSTEYRLAIKFLDTQRGALETALFAAHPYKTPEWVVIEAHSVSEKYLSWARSLVQS